jgi:hypothetical protein
MSQESQTITTPSGKVITISEDQMREFEEEEVENSFFSSMVAIMDKAGRIARSSSEKSTHNYTVKINFNGKKRGNRRWGGSLWLAIKTHVSDDETLATLQQQFPNAKVEISDRP